MGHLSIQSYAYGTLIYTIICLWDTYLYNHMLMGHLSIQSYAYGTSNNRETYLQDFPQEANTLEFLENYYTSAASIIITLFQFLKIIEESPQKDPILRNVNKNKKNRLL